MAVIKRYGGIAIVQNLDEALVPSMPLHVCQSVEVDFIAKSAEIGGLINRLVRQSVSVPEKGTNMSTPDDELDPDIAEYGAAGLEEKTYSGPPSAFTCPECGGALWEVGQGEILRYRCHVGHGYTSDSLVSEQMRNLEAALWTALRALEENAELNRRMAARAQQANLAGLLESYQQRAMVAEERANVIRDILLKSNNGNEIQVTEPRNQIHHQRRPTKRRRTSRTKSSKTSR